MTAARRQDAQVPAMTVEAFLDWPGDGTGRKFELVDGVPRAMAPASMDHGVIRGNVVTAFNNHFRGADMRCRAATEGPVVPPFKSRINAWAPDVVVTCTPPSTSRVADEPLLIVKLLSPSNEDETWACIRALAGLRSLQEIVAVWSTRVEAEVYRRTPAGDWPTEPETIGPGGIVHLASIGLHLPIAEVYRMTLLAEAAGGAPP
ncbi:MAG: Uma2 family endonuclease [Rhodospirillales bacterium]|nr:Uma2 family endonuclease [Rhodospirillales bacterium]